MTFRFTPLLILFTTISIHAFPLFQPNPVRITVPLEPLQIRSNVHPLIRGQEMINRGTLRLARITGRAPPSAEVLSDKIRRRVLEVESRSLERRYYKVNSPKKHAASTPPSGLTAAKANSTSSKDSSVGGPDSKNNVTVQDNPNIDNGAALDIVNQDVGYAFTVAIGNPPKNFLMLADSGSGDFWVTSANCVSTEGGDCGKHQILSNDSTTFKNSGELWNITYGSGALNGTKVQDDVTIVGHTLKAHKFGVSDSETPDFSSDETSFDGILGLSRSELSAQGVLTPIESLVEQKLVKEPITSFKLARLKDNKKDGSIVFGGLDDKLFDKNSLVELDNLNKGFWEAQLDGASVDQKDANCNGRRAVLDTGTTLMLLPEADAASVHGNIDGAQETNGTFTVPCNTKASVQLQFGGKSFAIDTRDIVLDPVDEKNQDCFSGIQVGDIAGNGQVWLVGAVFLKNVYFSTNVATNKITLAKLT